MGVVGRKTEVAPFLEKELVRTASDESPALDFRFLLVELPVVVGIGKPGCRGSRQGNMVPRRSAPGHDDKGQVTLIATGPAMRGIEAAGQGPRYCHRQGGVPAGTKEIVVVKVGGCVMVATLPPVMAGSIPTASGHASRGQIDEAAVEGVCRTIGRGLTGDVGGKVPGADNPVRQYRPVPRQCRHCAIVKDSRSEARTVDAPVEVPDHARPASRFARRRCGGHGRPQRVRRTVPPGRRSPECRPRCHGQEAAGEA